MQIKCSFSLFGFVITHIVDTTEKVYIMRLLLQRMQTRIKPPLKIAILSASSLVWATRIPAGFVVNSICIILKGVPVFSSRRQSSLHSFARAEKALRRFERIPSSANFYNTSVPAKGAYIPLERYPPESNRSAETS